MTEHVDASPRLLMVGAGVMGSAVARALLGAGYGVTVWNRTPSRIAPLISEGAVEATTLLDGLRDADVILVCVADQKASRELLANDAAEAALRGKTLVQLTTGTASDGRGNADWAAARAVRYLDGAIIAYPRDVGTSSATVLYSGDASVFSVLTAVLNALGVARFVGDDAGLAGVFDASLIAFFYGNLVGYIQGAALVKAEDGELSEYLEMVTSLIPTFITNAVRDLGERSITRDYSDAQSSMQTHLGGIDLLVLGSSQDAGVRTEVMEAIRDTFVEAVDDGHGPDDIAVLIQGWGMHMPPDEAR
jgi:3-hydroxyisobutyrate dehydrogenase-like beta-hydroxyacid dehydrogenase